VLTTAQHTHCTWQRKHAGSAVLTSSLDLAWSPNSSRCLMGSFNSVYALHTSRLLIKSSKRSVRPGRSRCLQQQQQQESSGSSMGASVIPQTLSRFMLVPG
jgi:hypothetical protein